MKRNKYLTTSLISLLCATFTLQLNAQSKDDGTYYDAKTGLTWMRCMIGQRWQNGICYGTSLGVFKYKEALLLSKDFSFAGKSDWRLPNIRELLTIVDYSTKNNALDTYVFPRPNWQAATLFWSSSLLASSTSLPWIVEFGDGTSFQIFSTNGAGVRLVRGDSLTALLNLARPNTDYFDHGNGTVTHKPTKLTWKRCMEGQTWTGTTCDGLPTSVDFDTAKNITSVFANESDWRLPNINELQSLVDYTIEDSSIPAINNLLFPENGKYIVWSDTINPNYRTDAFAISFNGGYVIYSDRNTLSAVRLVRNSGETPFAPESNNDCLLNWVESRFPQFFTQANSPTQTLGTISYRAYTGNVFLGVDSSNDAILALGGSFGSSPVTVGKMAEYLPIARSTSCR